APSVIHALIKKGNIDEKKIDEATKKLEKVFPVVTYYGVLLLIAAYILEKGREKSFVAKPSMIYSQIDMAGSGDIDGLLASFDGNAEEAIKSLERGIRSLEEIGKTKELAKNKFRLAMILHKHIGRIDEAEKEYREVISIDPDDAPAHNNLGVLLTDLKRYEEAEKEYREVIRINPNLSVAHYNFGILLANLKRFKEVEKEYREAIRINPDSAEAHGNLGILYSETKRPEEAKKELEIAKRRFEAEGRDEDVKKAEELLSSLKQRG
ncbi:MAG: tetratricopeptide repeat protein, partial [Methanophagales archaeon]|nr:tetratricopeptide repeat protein [Methanophagales archaeon]